NVFTAIAPTGSSVGSTGANGIASTKSGLFSTVISAFSSYEKNFRFDALSNVTDQLNKQIKRVGELEDKIVTLSESYYKKFAAMESAVAKLQEQQSSIAGLLSASSK
ncbi:MAG: flagellar filament capping protein FliD, partial [Oscillospiraceae bacterium]|nr:flagellar filament capping protein FliD [Oscillospiraceae bacterium]